MSTIVQFESRAGNLIMFKEHAVPILKGMGLSGEIPSAILPDDIERALDLIHECAFMKIDDHVDDNQNKARISQKTRALPLIELLVRAQKRKCEVIWR